MLRQFRRVVCGIVFATVLGTSAFADGVTNSNILLVNSSNARPVKDCVGFVREQKRLAKANRIELNRKDQKSLLHQCRNGELEAHIAQQQRILAALDAEIRQIELRIDQNNHIVDDQGRKLAEIQSINGRLVIQIENTNARIAAKLAEAERILRALAQS